MKHILKTTDMRRYNYMAAAGAEPLRNYRKTISLLQSRLRDSYPDFSDMLATPNVQSDGNIEWTTERFATLPRPLNALRGEERAYYGNLLQKSMARLGNALAALPVGADVAELHAIATVPSEEAIYCADDRIVIAEWGLRPASGASGLSLLSFADTVEEKPVKPVVAPPTNLDPHPNVEKSHPSVETHQNVETPRPNVGLHHGAAALITGMLHLLPTPSSQF